MGPAGIKQSYNLLASVTLHAWKVNCKQQHPIPKPMASK